MQSNAGDRTRARSARGKGRPYAEEDKVGRDALITATRDLLRSTPPDRISLSEIARHAGVDRALIRYYFGNREQLLLAAALQTRDELRDLSAAAFSSMAAPEDGLRNYVRGMMKTMAENPYFHQLMMELALSGKDLDSKDSSVRVVAERLANIEEWLRAIGYTQDTERHARFLFFAVIGMCEQFFRSRSLVRTVFGETAPDRDLAQKYEDFVVSMVMGMLAEPPA